MATTFQNLIFFIQKAERLGKYKGGTAAGFRSAIEALQSAWTSDEPHEAHYLTTHAEEILARHAKTREFSALTLRTYVQRVQRVISDWQAYGDQPKALLEWRPKHVSRRSASSAVSRPRLKTLVWSLRPNLVIQLQLPTDFNAEDRRRLNRLLDLEAEMAESVHPQNPTEI